MLSIGAVVVVVAVTVTVTTPQQRHLYLHRVVILIRENSVHRLKESAHCWRLTNSLNGHHSYMVSSAPTILRPWVWIPSTPSTLFSICIPEILIEEDKNKKEARIGPRKSSLNGLSKHASIQQKVRSFFTLPLSKKLGCSSIVYLFANSSSNATHEGM